MSFCSLFGAPSSHQTLCLTSQDHGESFTEQSGQASANDQENGHCHDGPPVLKTECDLLCIKLKGNIHDLLVLLPRMLVDSSNVAGAMLFN
jgi:hypothetical protein